jgi:hypothetical protein
MLSHITFCAEVSFDELTSDDLPGKHPKTGAVGTVGLVSEGESFFSSVTLPHEVDVLAGGADTPALVRKLVAYRADLHVMVVDDHNPSSFFRLRMTSPASLLQITFI